MTSISKPEAKYQDPSRVRRNVLRVVELELRLPPLFVVRPTAEGANSHRAALSDQHILWLCVNPKIPDFKRGQASGRVPLIESCR